MPRSSSRRHSKARHGYSSTRWSTPRCRAAWATSCTRWLCKPARPRNNRVHQEDTMSTDATVTDRIKQDIADNTVVLFMKGTPVFPQCGFSARVVQILTQLGVKFKGIDVLADPAIRQGVKDFSNWPTIPQLYVKGEFVGGCDIVSEMYENGELKQVFADKGVATRA